MYETECKYYGVWKNYYYVWVLEAVTYDFSTASVTILMDFEFEKYGKCNVFIWKHIQMKVLLLLQKLKQFVRNGLQLCWSLKKLLLCLPIRSCYIWLFYTFWYTSCRFWIWKTCKIYFFYMKTYYDKIANKNRYIFTCKCFCL